MCGRNCDSFFGDDHNPLTFRSPESSYYVTCAVICPESGIRIRIRVRIRCEMFIVFGATAAAPCSLRIMHCGVRTPSPESLCYAKVQLPAEWAWTGLGIEGLRGQRVFSVTSLKSTNKFRETTIQQKLHRT